MTARGQARYGRGFELNPTEKGWFEPSSPGQLWPADREAPQAFTWETILFHPEPRPPTGNLFSVDSNNGETFLHLAIAEDTLRVTGPAGEELHSLPEYFSVNWRIGSPNHLAISVEDTSIKGFLNGQLILEGNLSEKLLNGSNRFRWGSPPTWPGLWQNTALHNRQLEPAEILQQAESSLQSVPYPQAYPPSIIVAELEVVRASTIPTPEGIAPYRRALAVNEYRVVNQISGRTLRGEILMAHWVIMDGMVVNEQIRTPGQVIRATFQPFDERPELTGEFLADDLEIFDLPLYYQIEP